LKDVEEDGADVVEEFLQSAGEYVDDDGVIHPAGADSQESAGRDAERRPGSGLANLRAVMNTAEDTAQQQNWHIPIDF